ncbi:MAG: hypothetical protein PF961_10450 [Planctomycetota bacterium]|jgi:hypothetical protein|nr:hypothetical protein [Planctomycetota bacterium]
MNRRLLANGFLLSVNLAVGVWVVTHMADSLLLREGEVAEARAAAAAEHQAATELEYQVAVQEATLAGIRADDPYVIELLAREKLGWRGENEILPPPLPSP